MPRKGQTPLIGRCQRVTMPGGYGDPPFRIERECAATLKHFLPHFFALFPTFPHSKASVKPGQALNRIFFNDNKYLQTNLPNF